MEDLEASDYFVSPISRDPSITIVFDDRIKKDMRTAVQDSSRGQTCISLIHTIAGCIVYYGCIHFGQQGIKAGNYYTSIHVSFNTAVLELLIILNSLQFLLKILEHNAGFRTRIKCIDLTWALFLVIFRVIVVGYMFYLAPPYINCMKRAWNLN